MLGFISRHMIQFNVFFVHAVRYGSEFIFFFCMQTPNCSSIICWKRIALSCPVVHLYGCISTPLICLFLYQSHTVLVTVVSQSWFRYCQSSNVAAVLRSCQLLCIFCMSIPILQSPCQFFHKNPKGFMNDTVLNLQINLRADILTVLEFPGHGTQCFSLFNVTQHVSPSYSVSLSTVL